MKNSLYKLWLLAAVLLLSGSPALHLEARTPNHSNAERAKKRTFGGAYLQFDANSAAQLKSLLRAVAVYAAGGRQALENHGKREGGAALQISHQIK